MLQPDSGLYEAAYRRCSRRKYVPQPMFEQDYATLAVLADRIQEAVPNLRIVLSQTGAEQIFQSRHGYGFIAGSKSFMALIVKGDEVQDLVRLGYYGQWMVLEATKLGLGTCWAAGTFNRSSAVNVLSLDIGEKLICVSPLGEASPEKSIIEKTMALLVGNKKRKKIEEIYIGTDIDKLLPWQRTALDCARVSPSAINLQPWRFICNNDRMRIKAAPGKTYEGTVPVDCGIAMFQFAVGAKHEGIHGIWTAAPDPFLAEFVPDAPIRRTDIAKKAGE